MVIPPGQDAATRRRAEGRGVHVGVGQAVFRQLVEHRCLDQPAEGRQLAIADIVKHEEDDVGCTFRGAFEFRPGRRGFLNSTSDNTGEGGPVLVYLEFCHGNHIFFKEDFILRGIHSLL